MPKGRRSPSPKRHSVPSRTVSSSPAPQQNKIQVRAPAEPKQLGLFGEMAAISGGVAVGSAIGHTVGHAVSGLISGGGSNNQAQQIQPVLAMSIDQSNQQGGPCAFEIKQFLQCAQNNDDISLCSGFNEAIRQCKEANGRTQI
ncbi:coiled-coil-helix-coiled-coil-helix domain-containing protein 2-like [Adelges cooleyi]|uniref:coiled-coil-helix-coiled-coil-helix domain-containing protein 2-like n=1 Tax=Adelges cooleyi TaxID=133065 RepID=UPI002180913A|nr:coiled-coil-helix-coiled-coil-helix domain-containing protein 2-like [Adelges cooleyi]